MSAAVRPTQRAPGTDLPEESMLTDLERRQLLKRVINENPERAVVLDWMLLEWTGYAGAKFFKAGQGPDDHEAEMESDGWQEQSWWQRQMLQYIDRAVITGVGERVETVGDELSLRGRQAAMKSLMVHFDGNACMIRHHGLPPEPGHSSSEDPTVWEYTNVER